MHQAKSTLSNLVERAEAGEEIVLARAGTPVARIVPVRVTGKRTLGRWKGRVRMSADFDSPLDAAELSAWQGRAP